MKTRDYNVTLKGREIAKTLPLRATIIHIRSGGVGLFEDERSEVVEAFSPYGPGVATGSLKVVVFDADLIKFASHHSAVFICDILFPSH